MNYLVVLALFVVVAGWSTQPLNREVKREMFHILLDNQTRSAIHVHRHDIKGPYMFSLKNMLGESLLEGLPELKYLEFQIAAESCSLMREKDVSFYCFSLELDRPLGSQKLEGGQEIHLISFSSYPFRGKVFNSQTARLEDTILYKTSLVLKKGEQSFKFDFHTSETSLQHGGQKGETPSKPPYFSFSSLAEYFSGSRQI